MAKQDKTRWILIAGAAAAGIYFATRPKAATVPISNVPLQQKFLPEVQIQQTELGISDILSNLSSPGTAPSAPALTINPAELPALQPMSLDVQPQNPESAGITDSSNYEA